MVISLCTQIDVLFFGLLYNHLNYLRASCSLEMCAVCCSIMTTVHPGHSCYYPVSNLCSYIIEVLAIAGIYGISSNLVMCRQINAYIYSQAGNRDWLLSPLGNERSSLSGPKTFLYCHHECSSWTFQVFSVSILALKIIYGKVKKCTKLNQIVMS